jgi:hypothetical protein
VRLPGRTFSPSLTGPDGAPVAMIEVLPVVAGQRLQLVFESSYGDWRHGVWLAVEGGDLLVNGAAAAQLTLWQDTAPRSVEITVPAADGDLRLYNVWELGGLQRSQSNNCGMLRETVPGGYRFRCSDYGVEADYRHLVFTITR